MAQPLYFVEDLACLGRNQAEQLGISDKLPTIESRQTTRGPSGGGGVLAGVTADRLAYSAEGQTWRRLPGGRVWFGFWNDAKPTPMDLKRDEQLPGYSVKLRDGYQWLVPMARAWSEMGIDPKIPASLDFDDDGNVRRGAVEPRFRDLEEAAKQYLDFFIGEGKATYELLLKWAVDAIAINYRIGKFEALALGLFDDQFLAAQEVLRAAIDWPGFVAISGKKQEGLQSGDQSTPPGVAA